MNPMKFITLFLFCTLFIASGLAAKSSVWKVSKGDRSVYLGGTCHILRPSDYPLPAEFEAAYAAADLLVFEVDPAKLQDPAFTMRMLAESRYSDGRTLKSVLSGKAYRALAAQCEKTGLPIEMLDRIKPGMAVTMLTLQELAKRGISQEGVDLHYHGKALRDGKGIQGLESAEFQLRLVTSIGDGIEDEFVLYSLEDLEQIETLFDELIRTWKNGDLQALDKLFIADMAEYPDLYASMLLDRNKNWLPQIETMLETPETEFVLVGVAHIAGKDGLLAMLREEGYTVVQSKAP